MHRSYPDTDLLWLSLLICSSTSKSGLTCSTPKLCRAFLPRIHVWQFNHEELTRLDLLFKACTLCGATFTIKAVSQGRPTNTEAVALCYHIS